MIHGAVMLAAVGGVLGWRAGRFLLGLPLGAAGGIGGAALYYLLMLVLPGGMPSVVGAMIAAWAALWLAFAVLDARLLRRGGRPIGIALLRGVVAAALGGGAFFLVLNVLWGAAPDGRSYLLQLGAWAFALAPGILVIGLPSRRDRAPVEEKGTGT